MGPEARKVEMFGGHTQIRKIVDNREIKARWECCTQNVEKTKARTWGENTWNCTRHGEPLLEKTTGQAGGEEGRQGEVSTRRAHVRHVQRSHSSGQRRERYQPHRHPVEILSSKGLWRCWAAGVKTECNVWNCGIYIPLLIQRWLQRRQGQKFAT